MGNQIAAGQFIGAQAVIKGEEVDNGGRDDEDGGGMVTLETIGGSILIFDTLLSDVLPVSLYEMIR